MHWRKLLILACSLVAICARAEQRLNVFIYSEYLPPEVIAEFEQRFDCKVIVDFYEDSEIF